MSKERFISHKIIAKEVLGISPKAVLETMHTGVWGDVFKISGKQLLVERERFNEWIGKHRVKTLKRA